MKIEINNLREHYILPSSNLDDMSKLKMTDIKINDCNPNNKWWQNKYTLYFDENIDGDIQQMNYICSSCGDCCKNLLDHQIRIYMTESEVEKIIKKDYPYKLENKKIVVDNTNFFVTKINENGDCSYLQNDGCLLNDDKPLWCKMFYCEKVFGGKYGMEEQK